MALKKSTVCTCRGAEEGRPREAQGIGSACGAAAGRQTKLAACTCPEVRKWGRC